MSTMLSFGWRMPGSAASQELPLVVVQAAPIQQWSNLTARLEQTPWQYCTVTPQPETWPTPQPNQGLVLFNLKTLEENQVAQIEQWLQAGGQVIVTGATGTLSSESARSRLQALLGSTWAFPLPGAASLVPLPATPVEAVTTSAELAYPLGGATLLPTHDQAQVLAQWQAPRPTPAIIATDQTAHLGWQWGADAIAGAETDIAGLQQIIEKQGIAVQIRQGENSGDACPLTTLEPDKPPPTTASGQTVVEQGNAAIATKQITAPLAPAPQPVMVAQMPLAPIPNSPATPDAPSPIAQPSISQRELAQLLAAAPSNLRQRYTHLNQLINRYESAVIAVESHHNPSDRQTFVETVENLGESEADIPPLPPGLQQVRQETAQLVRWLANQDYDQVNTGIQRLERLIWQQYPIEQPVSYPASRAIWLDRGTIVRTRSERELARIFNRLADAGINTVFFETLNASYPIYPSRVAPEQNPLTQGWDPLAAAVKLAHERGMELHAWVWIFAAANQRHNAILGQPPEYLGPVLSRHPDWAMLDRQGDAFHPNTRKAFYDPANPELRRYLLDIVDEIATEYDVDGIQLDYIRYPFQDPRTDLTFGYGIAARRQFYQQTGVDPATIRPTDGRWRQWTNFRMAQVSQFVEAAATLLQEQHPDVLLSAAVFPFPAQERLVKLQQNWEVWLDQDYLDFLVPMTYAKSTTEFDTLTAPVLNQGGRSSTLLLPGIRILQLPTVGTLDQLQHLQDRATGGYALFAAENLSLTLQNSLQGRHGRQTAQTNEPIAHRQPLATALARYQALQNEWQYWVAHQQLAVEQPTLTEWANQAALLEAKLATASQSPSESNLRSAQRQLRQFEQQFDRWLAPVAQDSPYRVQVWQNRLAGIDQLLRYGQRRGNRG
ncbi:MAG: family 10 glycosylhydrolase [Spirulina sp. SIO3F2]|nr:family 10 glycosylhydrolase [Spirulina sp. SIO3F2]